MSEFTVDIACPKCAFKNRRTVPALGFRDVTDGLVCEGCGYVTSPVDYINEGIWLITNPEHDESCPKCASMERMLKAADMMEAGTRNGRLEYQQAKRYFDKLIADAQAGHDSATGEDVDDE